MPISPTRTKILELYNLAIKLNGGSYRWGSISRIADIVGVSRERAGQILAENGITARDEYISSEQEKRCFTCSKPFWTKKANRLYCSAECRQSTLIKRHTVTATCKNCNTSFEYYQPSVNHKRVYCSRLCMGKYLGEHHGWGVKQ